ncbi:CidA/LrgA family protein [Nocardioides marmoriginsengisoli]|uniref:CidA/LrgA family protein n=1 Tax=Nocardioides marmoriginsengisoli TaxID=661483 RepID=UPI00161BCAF9|nr:CidA/LrgA family protein [Nocardioides marmoriginsengisoli]
MANPPVLRGILALLGCQLAGEVLVRLTGIEFPGAVVGMLLFFVVLRLRRPGDSSGLVAAPKLLLTHLHLLFIPAGVGIVVYLGRIRDDALPLAAGIWVSWLAGFVVTAWVAALLLRLGKDRG